MQSLCKMRRRGLTLIELVVVMAVLVALAALVLPRITGVREQANSAANSNTIGEVNKAIGTYEARFNSSPSGWDGILVSSTGGTFYSQLNPKLQTSTTGADVTRPILASAALTAEQATKLINAGITGLHYNAASNTGLPSDSGTAYATITTGVNIATLFIPSTSTTPAWSGHGSTFPDRAFNIHPYSALPATDTYAVFGIGQPCSLRGKSMQDSPVVQSASPAQYYARVLVVYRIPADTTLTKAQFVGSFLPDGTGLNDNVNSYNSSAN